MDKAKWVGIVAMPSDDVSLRVKSEISQNCRQTTIVKQCSPDDVTFEGHYKSFCKQILWPTLHYQIPDDPKSKAFEDHSWGHYVLMNQLIADKIVETYNDVNDEETTVWIHDYHLLLVPKMVRDKLPNAKIGFSCMCLSLLQKFSVVCSKKPVVGRYVGANSMGFQTNEYVRHFCKRVIGCYWPIQVNWGVNYRATLP